MKKLLITITAAIAFAVSAIAGCGGDALKSKRYTFWGIMNSDATLVVSDYFDSDENADDRMGALIFEAGELLSALNKSLSATEPTSFVSQFNEAEAGERLEIDEYTYETLSTALQIYELTEGYYNPAVYYAVQAFGFNGSYFQPEKADELPAVEVTDAYADLASHFGELKVEEVDGKYYATKPEYTVAVNGETLAMKLDLGGVAKGYAVDKVDGLMTAHGYEYGYINFGSSSIALKKYRDGEYRMSFANPRGTSTAYIQTNISDTRLSSSGDYENFYIIDEVRYCHVFDPFTARPVRTGMMTATVIGGSASEDDALTTALMAMDPESAIDFISSKLTERAVAFTCEREGRYYYYTNMTEGSYTVTDKNFLPYTAGL